MLSRPTLFRLPMSLPGLGLGDTVYRRPTAPHRISKAGAAVVEATWTLRARETDARRGNAARLFRAIVRTTGLEPVRPISDSEAGWLRLPFLTPGRSRQDALLVEARRLGVMPGYPRSLEQLEALPAPEPKLPLPGAIRLAAELWTLPTHSQLNESDLVQLEALLERLGHSGPK
jgi:dTDP-4-amino-4,6-dideoxygalactose transaminase